MKTKIFVTVILLLSLTSVAWAIQNLDLREQAEKKVQDAINSKVPTLTTTYSTQATAMYSQLIYERQELIIDLLTKQNNLLQEEISLLRSILDNLPVTVEPKNP